MIVLLSFGEALLTQARDEKLVGGGAITVLPEGIDVEVMKTGGLGGLFFSIDHARFIYRQLLAAPRLAAEITAVAPQIEDKLLYLRNAAGAERTIMASGEIPSRTRAVGAMPQLASGAWTDDSLDRRWRDPTDEELRHDIDHFHLAPAAARYDKTWAEWHYFNVLSADRKKWAFISFIIAGEVPAGQWGGEVVITLHEQGGTPRRFVATAAPRDVRFSTTRADIAIAQSTVTVLADGRYDVRAHARDEDTGEPADLELRVAPATGAYFPGATLTSGETVSGYVVPALRAEATGRICVASRCEELSGVQAYHDHNWGTWRGVSWEWGAARAGQYTILYGRVESADSAVSPPLFAYLVDSLGFFSIFRPREIRYDDARTLRVGSAQIRVPARATMFDVRGDDTLRVELAIEDAAGTDTRRPAVERGDAVAPRQLSRPYFIQMKGTARLSGRVGGRVLGGEGVGFFETYR